MRPAIAFACPSSYSPFSSHPIRRSRDPPPAESSGRVPRAQARLEPSRGRDEQLVAHHVAETVVDDLEAIEIEGEHGEAAARPAPAALVEPAPERLDEHRTVERAGQRILESHASQLFLRERLFGRIGRSEEHTSELQ